MNTSTDNQDSLKSLLRLRLAVGALGEQNGWWPTKAASADRFVILQQLFPKTWRLASFSATSEAAKLVHRASLDGRSLHLFRLETDFEQNLRRLLASKAGEQIFDEVFATPESPAETLAALSLKGVHLREGPVQLGVAPDDVYTSLEKMAGLYGIAFRSGARCFPYFLPKDAEE